MAPLARGRGDGARRAPTRSPPTRRPSAKPPARRAPTRRSARASGSCSARCSASGSPRSRSAPRSSSARPATACPRAGRAGGRPPTTARRRPQQIAAHVGRQYRLSDGSQIVGVEGGPLEIDALGLTVPLEIAMKTAPQGGDIKFIKGNGLLYTLNGLGPKGAVRGGKPSTERALLLRREALELALYTLPLHRRTSTSSSRCCRRRRSSRSRSRARRARAAPRRPPRRRSRRWRCSSAPATSSRSSRSRSPRRSRRRPRARRRSRSPRPAASTRSPQQHVRLLLPAGPEPEGLPRAGPPT